MKIGTSSTARWATCFSPIPPFDRGTMRHEHAKAHNPLHPEYKVQVLMMDGLTPTTKMGRILCASESNLTAILDKLLSEGKVERTPDEGDRGVTNIAITDEGRQFMEEAEQTSRRKSNKGPRFKEGGGRHTVLIPRECASHP